MTSLERWATPADLAAARERFAARIPGWTQPLAHAVAFVPSGEAGPRPEHFPLVGTVAHRLPAVVLASVLGHAGGTGAFEVSREQLDRAITLLEPAEACPDVTHPNLWRWRDAIRPAWESDPEARVVAVFIGPDGAGRSDGDAVAALRDAVGRPLAWRERLRGLAVLPAEPMGFSVEGAPDDPRELFEEWLDAAISQGVSAPHAGTLSTAGPSGSVGARTLLLKDLDERGWWFATRTEAPKAVDLAADPHAALTFFWREHGRQVRVSGLVVDAGRDATAVDFLARPAHSRAAAIIGAQSAPLGSLAEYADAFAEAKSEIATHPDLVAPNWSAMVLQPTVVEFWAATSDGQVRLEYRRDALGGPWRHGLLWP
ncbi:pyridoxine/pyridoxamine 5'-phosphate oxidase [Microbacterium ulmi]|uniref:Pyridoxamine 5'-phosphate oxidase N-terminal domain-containing protein n=1 Tax=Microbacterium ulmi TaxID=179095 RepID=A0A7Y2M149_9MICO|nr:pyridoxamine 5'-phosphate oxidase family protein [Microbacterium ulmi]NII70660.1 pyridoxine/pyridoxamine 5'-phosphate oxidase [Microbacterium ulmi]NNH04099.1 hypothetical protein [Microbacterium ulmi]